MARSRYQLTPQIEHLILSFIRAGGFPEVASEAAGIPREVFNRWRRHGESRNAPERYRAFALAVRQAIAQARLNAEVEVHKERALDWLRNGPGRETANRPGWTGNARARTGTAESGDINFSDPRVQAHFQRLLDAVEPHPERRPSLAEEAAGADAKKVIGMLPQS
jgi:hypothetical protein